jgi:hypothetical protein
MPLLYSRLNESRSTFDPQRNLVTWAVGLNGGSTLAADTERRVFVAWHSNPSAGDEKAAAVYLTRSDDEGASFERERRVSDERLGACGCCSMRALVDRAGSLYVLYRAATDGLGRDMMMLTSPDHGTTFQSTRLHAWNLNACPLSSMFLAEGPFGVTGAWETRGQIFTANVSGASAVVPESPPGSGERKHPVLAYNGGGESLLVWLEGTGWAKGGSVAWQLYDASGRATSDRGSAGGVPTWGLAAAAPLADGRFLILY